MSDQSLNKRSFGKWWLPGQQEIECAAEAIDVGSTIGGVAVSSLFGRQIIGGSEDAFIKFPRQTFFTVKVLRQSKIQNSGRVRFAQFRSA